MDSEDTIDIENLDDNKFYGDAEKYWKNISPTVDGMLGGFSHISSTDIAGSTKFLHLFVKVNIALYVCVCVCVLLSRKIYIFPRTVENSILDCHLQSGLV